MPIAENTGSELSPTMKTMDARHYLLQVGIDRSKVASFDEYPNITR